KLISRAGADPEHAALYKLLASMIDPYIDSFDEEPLPVDVADQVFAQVLDIVRYAEDSVSRGAADQIQALNKIAAAELIQPNHEMLKIRRVSSLFRACTSARPIAVRANQRRGHETAPPPVFFIYRVRG